MKDLLKNPLRRDRRSNQPPSAPTAPLPTPSPAHQSTHPTSPNTTAIAHNPPPVSPATAFTDAQYVDASHSVFNTAGRDFINNYQLGNRMCFCYRWSAAPILMYYCAVTGNAVLI